MDPRIWNWNCMPKRPPPVPETRALVETAEVDCQTDYMLGEYIQIYHGDEMRPAMLAAMAAAKFSIYGAQYCFDDADVCALLEGKMRHSSSAPPAPPPTSRFGVKLILDDHQAREPSCSRQLERVVNLQEWGAEVRLLRVGRNLFDSLHQKVWLLDGHTLVTGSVNTTGHGLNANEEQLLIVSGVDHVMTRATANWMTNWLRAVPKTRADMVELKVRWEAKRSENRVRRSHSTTARSSSAEPAA